MFATCDPELRDNPWNPDQKPDDPENYEWLDQQHFEHILIPFKNRTDLQIHLFCASAPQVR